MFIRDNSTWLNIEVACVTLCVSKSAYYAWLGNYEIRQVKLAKEQELAVKVIDVFNRSRQTYGATRICFRLSKNEVPHTYKQVLEIMKVNDLVPRGWHKYRVTTTNSNHRYRVFENLLERNFTVTKPDLAWVSDISYIPTREGWLYLATVIDLYSRKVIGYKMSNRMTKDLVIGALLKALQTRCYPKQVIVHSDRGSQYASNEYKALLSKYQLHGSMSRKGDCWDNAVAESFFATLKKEYVYQTDFKTRVQAQLGIFDYIEAWYNNERIHSYLGDDSPVEFEMKYWAMAEANAKMKLDPYQSSGI